MALEWSEDGLVWFTLFITGVVPCQLYDSEVCIYVCMYVCMYVWVYVCDSNSTRVVGGWACVVSALYHR